MDENKTTVNETQAESSVSLFDFWMVFKKYLWRIVILTCIVTVVAGVMCKLFVKTKYTAKAVIMINPALAYGKDNENDNVSTDSDPNKIQGDRYAVQFGKEVMPSVLKYLTTSNKLRQTVEKASEIKDNVEPLNKGTLNVTNEEDTLQVELTYTTVTSPEVAVDTLNELIDSFCSSADEKSSDGKHIYFWAGTPNVDDYANEAQSSNNWKLYTLIAFVLSFIISYFYYFIMTMVDDSIKSKTVIENISGYHVMAYIEDINVDNKKTKKSTKKTNVRAKAK